MEHVIDHDAGVVFLCETWLKSKKNSTTAMFEEFGYKLYHDIRMGRAKEGGGGVGILVKSIFHARPVKSIQYQTYEHSILNLRTTNCGWLTLVSVYRLDYEPISLFFEEFSSLLESLAASYGRYIIAGDINIHCDDLNDNHTIRFYDLLQTFNLVQMIDKPTHRAGHTLDVVIIQMEDTELSNIEVEDISLSDHYLLSFKTDLKTSRSYYKTISFRNLKQLDLNQLRIDIQENIENITDGNNLSDVVSMYNNTLGTLMNKHAPLITKDVKIVKGAPWFDNEYKELRKKRRNAEKKYKRSNDPADKTLFKSLRKETTQLALRKKQIFYTSTITDATQRQKSLFSVVNKLMDSKKDSCLPTSDSDQALANKFQTFFKEKIMKIRETFAIPVEQTTYNNPPLSILSEFTPATEEELRNIINTRGISCSPTDPIPAKVLSSTMDLLLPVWLEIVNMSLSTGSMDCLKSAVLTPLLKEMDEFVDHEILKNYRPISNLAFISKLIERCVAIRLDQHMDVNNLESDNQYGYKKGHSTETLLINVVDRALTGFDNKFASIILLLDLSAAFDTVDQDKLLEILFNEIGVQGTAHKWFVSFTKGRSQQVKINNSFSNPELLEFGFPQGSVLAPRLFNIYTRSLYPHVEITMFEIDGYADDHQLMKQFMIHFQTEVLGYAINDCLREVYKWMDKFFLRLNMSKTKILVLAPPSIMQHIHIHGTFTDVGCIRFSECAKNLGVWLDKNLNFTNHVNKVVSSSFKTIKEIARIKYFIPEDCLISLITSLIFSKLDYCNALYYKIDSSLIDKLQSVQNAALRLIHGGHKYDRVSISHLFHELHWLKIKQRIVFKISLVVHKCIWGLAPNSLHSMIIISNTRTHNLVEKKFNGVYGQRSFSCCGPKLWNNLPLVIRLESDTCKFKKLLKSFLMTNWINFVTRVNIV